MAFVRVYAPAAILAACIFILALSLKSLNMDEHEPVAVVFPPGVDAAEAIARVLAAGGQPLRAGAFDNIIVARSEEADFRAGLHRQGAWLLLDPIFAGCVGIVPLPSAPATDEGQ